MLSIPHNPVSYLQLFRLVHMPSPPVVRRVQAMVEVSSDESSFDSDSYTYSSEYDSDESYSDSGRKAAATAAADHHKKKQNDKQTVATAAAGRDKNKKNDKQTVATAAAGQDKKKRHDKHTAATAADKKNDKQTATVVAGAYAAPIAPSCARKSDTSTCAPMELRTFRQARNMCTIPCEAGEVCHVCGQPASVEAVHIAWCDMCSTALVQRSGIRCIGPGSKVQTPLHALEHAHRWYRYYVRMSMHPMWSTNLRRQLQRREQGLF